MAFLLIVTRLYGLYQDPEVVPFQGDSLHQFPITKIALICKNGSVFDATIHWDQSLTLQFLFNLPNPTMYHGYADALGVLNFVDSEMKRPLLKG